MKTLDCLKGSKSKGVFDFDAKFLKNYKLILCKPLTHLINLSITNSYFPSSWKAPVVTLILKTGNRTLTSNYRPISILPIVSKITEKVVCDQLVSHLNKVNLLCTQCSLASENITRQKQQIVFLWNKSKVYLIKVVSSELCF